MSTILIALTSFAVSFVVSALITYVIISKKRLNNEI